MTGLKQKGTHKNLYEELRVVGLSATLDFLQLQANQLRSKGGIEGCNPLKGLMYTFIIFVLLN